MLLNTGTVFVLLLIDIPSHINRTKLPYTLHVCVYDSSLFKYILLYFIYAKHIKIKSIIIF